MASTEEESFQARVAPTDCAGVLDPSYAVLLTVAYDGTAFVGFAPQRGHRSVSSVLLEAVQRVDPSVSGLRGVSRTDSGVHARGQLVAFDPRRTIGARGWACGINSHLPVDLAVRQARLVAAGFQPRVHALKKRYRYVLLRDALRDPWLDRFSWRIVAPLDVERARAEASHILGTHDFAAFRTSRDQRIATERTISHVSVTEGVMGDRRLVALEVVGDAFLHNMVRIIVGTVVDVAVGRRSEGSIPRALASKKRDDLGMTAPPHGLSLDEVWLASTPEFTFGDAPVTAASGQRETSWP